MPRVFGARAVAENKRQWFACHGDWTPLDFQLDFRPGGSESNRVASTDGVIHAYQARYIDIVPNERIIYAFDMALGDERISVSLATRHLRIGANRHGDALYRTGWFSSTAMATMAHG